MIDIAPAHLAAIDKLIALINPDAQGAADQIAAYREAQQEADEDEYLDDVAIWLLKDVIDWKSGFFVDWKDRESFIGAIDVLAKAWGASVDWGVAAPLDDDFLNATTVPALMALAHGRLATQGLTLWNWDTGSDCYGGWIARAGDDGAMLALSGQLGVRFRPGDVPF